MPSASGNFHNENLNHINIEQQNQVEPLPETWTNKLMTGASTSGAIEEVEHNYNYQLNKKFETKPKSATN